MLSSALSRAARRPKAWDRPAPGGLPELRDWFASDIGGGAGTAGHPHLRSRAKRPGNGPARSRAARCPGCRRVTLLPRRHGSGVRRRAAHYRRTARRRRHAPRLPRRNARPHPRPRRDGPAPLPEPDRHQPHLATGARHPGDRTPARGVRHRGRFRPPPGPPRLRAAPATADRRRPRRGRRPHPLTDQGDLAQPSRRYPSSTRPRDVPATCRLDHRHHARARAPAVHRARGRHLTQLATCTRQPHQGPEAQTRNRRQRGCGDFRGRCPHPPATRWVPPLGVTTRAHRQQAVRGCRPDERCLRHPG